MNQAVNILHVEDSSNDSELVQQMLQENGLSCETIRVETRGDFIDALEERDYDLILSDCTLPQFSGLQALEIAHSLRPRTPFIFVSGTIGEETAIESLQNGATDYVLKHRLTRLVPAIRRALAESREKSLRFEAEERLRQAQRLEAIGTLVGGLVHDFKNLLQVIKTHVSLLPFHANQPEQVLKASEMLNKVTDRSSDLLQELLVFARKTDAHLTSVDLAPLAQETVEMLQASLPPNVKLVLRLDQELPPVFADPNQLSRILTNLVINASDAMPDGGTITISAEINRFDPLPPVSGQLEDVPYLCLKVTDTGTGMDEYTQLHVFEPFFTTKPSGKGTGLGLSVVFGLMRIHNGFINLQSKSGEGTTISLYFPLPQGSRIAPEKIKKVPPFQLWGGTPHPASTKQALKK